MRQHSMARALARSLHASFVSALLLASASGARAVDLVAIRGSVDKPAGSSASALDPCTSCRVTISYAGSTALSAQSLVITRTPVSFVTNASGDWTTEPYGLVQGQNYRFQFTDTKWPEAGIFLDVVKVATDCPADCGSPCTDTNDNDLCEDAFTDLTTVSVTTGADLSAVDHGVLRGLEDDDHPGYITEAELEDHAHTWDSVTGKPLTMPPGSHTIGSHSDAGATGTGANLQTLTDGSNADALHVHAGALNLWTESSSQNVAKAGNDVRVGGTTGNPGVLLDADGFVEAEQGFTIDGVALASTHLSDTASITLAGPTVEWADITDPPTTFDPTAHAASHREGGTDEVGLATYETADLGDVTADAPDVDDVLRWNGTAYEPQALPSAIGGADDLDDVTTSSETAGQVFVWSGTAWVNRTLGGDIASVSSTGTVALANNSVGTADVADGTLLGADLSASAGLAASQLTPGAANTVLAGGVSNSFRALVDADLPSGATLDSEWNTVAKLETATGVQIWTDADGALDDDDLTDNDLADLADVAATAPNEGELLGFESGAWRPVAAGGAGSLDLDDLTDVTAAGATSAQVLILDGSGEWRARTLSGDVTNSLAGVATIANGAINGAKLATGAVDLASGDVTGRATVDNLPLMTEGHFLRGEGLSSPGGAAITDADLPSTVALDTELHSAVTLAGTPDYLTLAGQVITRGLVDLATDVTGVAPDANVADDVTISADAAVSIEAAEISDLHAGTDPTADLEEEDHASEHENGGADEISVTGLSGLLASAQLVGVSKNSGAIVGTRAEINLIEGSGVTLTVSDDAGNGEVDVTIAATGGAGSVENVFSTIDAPAGTDPVADDDTDTLTLAVGGDGPVVTGNSTTDTLTLSLDETLIDLATLAGQVEAGQIADDAVGTDQIANDAVTTAKILDLTVGTADLAATSVTEAKLGAGAVTSVKILDGTIAAVDIDTDAVGADEIIEGGVGASEIAPGAVTGSELAAASVDLAGVDVAGLLPLANLALGTDGQFLEGNGLSAPAYRALVAADMPGEVMRTDTVETVTAVHTYSGRPAFNSTGAPFTVTSGTLVANLNTDTLDGLDSAAFALASHAHAGADITSGTVAEARIHGDIHRDAETKDGDLVSFDDSGSNFAATDVDSAIAELDTTNGSGVNAADGKVSWTQLTGVPAGFADGADASGTFTGTLDDVYANGSDGANHDVVLDEGNIVLQTASAATDYRLTLDNTSSGTVDIGLQVAVSGGSGVTTTGIDISEAKIVNALALGENGVTWNAKTISAAEGGVLDGGILFSELGGGESVENLTIGTGGTLSPDGGDITANLVSCAGCVSDADAANDLTLAGATIGTSAITLVQSASPAPTAEGRIEWETDVDRLILGNGATQSIFYNAADLLSASNTFVGAIAADAVAAAEIANGTVGAAELASASLTNADAAGDFNFSALADAMTLDASTTITSASSFSLSVIGTSVPSASSLFNVTATTGIWTGKSLVKITGNGAGGIGLDLTGGGLDTGIALGAMDLTTTDSALLDLSAISHGTTDVMGFKLPSSAVGLAEPATGEGYLAWDSAANAVMRYDGISWEVLGGSGTFLDTAADDTFSDSTWDVFGNSVDGADQYRWRRGAGGAASATRGAYDVLYGNEHANAGDYEIHTGGTAGSVFLLDAFDEIRLSLLNSGEASPNDFFIDADGFHFENDSGVSVEFTDAEWLSNIAIRLNAVGLIFEGATPDAFETTITATDPTVDRAIVWPNAGGTPALLGSTITETIADAGFAHGATDFFAANDIAAEGEVSSDTALIVLTDDTASTGVSITTSGLFARSASNSWGIVASATDNTDTQANSIGGGGTLNASRGAFGTFFGNEHATNPADVLIQTGDISGGDFRVEMANAGSSARFTAEGGTVDPTLVFGATGLTITGDVGDDLILGEDIFIQFEGDTADAHETRLMAVDTTTADKIVTIPNPAITTTMLIAVPRAAGSYGVLLPGVGSSVDAAYDTGDEVCVAAGLTCMRTWSLAGTEATCSATSVGWFNAVCRGQ